MIKKDHGLVVLCMADLRSICIFDFKTDTQIHTDLLFTLFCNGHFIHKCLYSKKMFKMRKCFFSVLVLHIISDFPQIRKVVYFNATWHQIYLKAYIFITLNCSNLTPRFYSLRISQYQNYQVLPHCKCPFGWEN